MLCSAHGPRPGKRRAPASAGPVGDRASRSREVPELRADRDAVRRQDRGAGDQAASRSICLNEQVWRSTSLSLDRSRCSANVLGRGGVSAPDPRPNRNRSSEIRSWLIAPYQPAAFTPYSAVTVAPMLAALSAFGDAGESTDPCSSIIDIIAVHFRRPGTAWGRKLLRLSS